MVTTRDRIIVATNELFRRQGYNGTSLKQISAAADATIGSIYHFFPGGKEALGVAVIETTGEVYRDLFVTVTSASTDPAGAFDEFFSAGAAIIADTDFLDPCPIGTVAREVANTSEPLRIAAKAAFDSWIDAACVHLTAAGIADDEARDLAGLFVATIEGNFVLARTQRDSRPLVVAGRYMAALTTQAIDRNVRAR